MKPQRKADGLGGDSKNERILGIVNRFRFSGIALVFSLLSFSPAWGQGQTSTLTTNWNKTPANDTLWMSSVFSLSAPATNGETIFLNNASVSFPFNGSPETVSLPNAEIIYSSAFSTTTTTYNSATNTWVTDVPLANASPKTFLTGFGWPVPFPGITSNISGNQVSMTGTFSASTATSLQWQWSAAAYNTFSSDPNALNVLPQDGSGLHAGTPTAFANPSFVDQGGSGGGSSNFTGSYSPTGSVNVPQAVPEPGSAALLLSLGMVLFVKRGSLRRLSNPRPSSQRAGWGNLRKLTNVKTA